MSNNEVLEDIFETISKKIVNEYLKEIKVTVIENEKSKYKYQYSNNLKPSTIKNSIKKNIDQIVEHITKNLNIEDKISIEKIVNDHLNSKKFESAVSKLSSKFVTDKKYTSDEIRNIYYRHLKFNLMNSNIKEKILALASETSFESWVKKRWKLVMCGYAMVLFILFLTYYVFISDNDN